MAVGRRNAGTGPAAASARPRRRTDNGGAARTSRRPALHAMETTAARRPSLWYRADLSSFTSPVIWIPPLVVSSATLGPPPFSRPRRAGASTPGRRASGPRPQIRPLTQLASTSAFAPDGIVRSTAPFTVSARIPPGATAVISRRTEPLVVEASTAPPSSRPRTVPLVTSALTARRSRRITEISPLVVRSRTLTPDGTLTWYFTSRWPDSPAGAFVSRRTRPAVDVLDGLQLPEQLPGVLVGHRPARSARPTTSTSVPSPPVTSMPPLVLTISISPVAATVVGPRPLVLWPGPSRRGC